MIYKFSFMVPCFRYPIFLSSSLVKFGEARVFVILRIVLLMALWGEYFTFKNW
jgi:hypothetical protein